MITTVLFGTAVFKNLAGKVTVPVALRFHALADFRQAGTLKVRFSDFPELQKAGGSIRIGTSAIVKSVEDGEPSERPAGLFAPVLINRGPNDRFYVLSAECAHAGCSVHIAESTGIMHCPCHGSQYALDGTVVHEPAKQDLQRLHFRQTTEALEIEMPDVFYEITSERVGPADRVAIKFIAFVAITYRVVFRESLNGVPEPVPFSRSLAGPADQLEAPGIDDYLTVFVDVSASRRTGFFQVVMKTEPV